MLFSSHLCYFHYGDKADHLAKHMLTLQDIYPVSLFEVNVKGVITPI